MRTRTLIPAALLLYGCVLHRRPPVPEPARGPAGDSLFRFDQTRGDSIAARGPVAGVVALLAPDVVYLRAGVPAVYGREAARIVIADEPASGSGNPSWQ